MALLTLNGVSLAFGGPPLLDGVQLAIEEGERLGLLGRNGTGKSTLLGVLAGTLPPDAGDVVRRPGLRVAALQQDVPVGLTGTVRAFLHHACGVHASTRAWEIETRIDRVAHDLALDLGGALDSLSAGTRRRVLLAAALVQEPDLLLLDEPTNHLDLGTIAALEEALLRRGGTLVFVTHDRAFLRRFATRILELDRGALRSYPGDYDRYLETRDAERRVEVEQDALFDRKLAQEEAWIRRGIKARRTRDEGRVRRLEALRLERAARRDEPGRVRASLQESERSGKIVLRCEDAGFAWGEAAPVVRGLTTTVLRGDRVGILGPNGCGKTTLLRLLLGELAPTTGSVTHGVRLEVAHFEQLHDGLDPDRSVLENVADGRETIGDAGTGRHVVGYLRDFLFTPEQMRGPVHKLSGGERRRLQIARLLSRPRNLLVLDEPTNDLDLETLELLEDWLDDFGGTLFVVSHDREFLDNVVTSTLVCEEGGTWHEYVGGYADWLRQRPEPVVATPARTGKPAARPAAEKPRRASFREKRELAELPARIEALEAEKQRLFDTLASPELYTTRAAEVAPLRERLAALDAELEGSYARWLELEGLAGGEA